MRSFMVIVLTALVSPVLAGPVDIPDDSTTQTSLQTSGLSWQGWGVRAGVTDGSDQVVAGAHINFGEVMDNVRFQPDFQLGSGDDHTTFYGTAPLYYRFDTTTRVKPYAGGGIAFGYVDRDLPPGSSADDSTFEFGARATGGLEWPGRDRKAFFIELSLGFGDVHDATLMAAWSF